MILQCKDISLVFWDIKLMLSYNVRGIMLELYINSEATEIANLGWQHQWLPTKGRQYQWLPLQQV